MNWSKISIGAEGFFLFLLGATPLERKLTPNKPTKVELGETKVDVQCYSLNEGGYIEETLRTLMRQPFYDSENVTITVVDSKSSDRTVEIAEKYADRVWTAPRGKLNARDFATRKTDADIIVSTDADTLYPLGWLSHMLRPFQKPGVVAVHGPKLGRNTIWRPWRGWWSIILHKPFGVFSATNSAFRRWAYLKTGGFDLSVNQTDWKDRNWWEWSYELKEEEERKFPERLKSVGRIEYVDVAVFTSDRHLPCSFVEGVVGLYNKQKTLGVRF